MNPKQRSHTIMVVEDEPDIQELLENFLQEAGYTVATANDGMEALALFSQEQFDLILLDILLPKIDGFSVCECIRRQSQVPIIMLTALSGEEEQIRGLDLLVDDYITKPFSVPVLIRKIAAVLRRSAHCTSDTPQVIAYQNLLLDLDGFTAVVDGQTYELTQREFEILRYLAENQGRVISRERLYETIWGDDSFGCDNTVMVHIRHLREKIEDDPAAPRYIITMKGLGYKLVDPYEE